METFIYQMSGTVTAFLIIVLFQFLKKKYDDYKFEKELAELIKMRAKSEARLNMMIFIAPFILIAAMRKKEETNPINPKPDEKHPFPNS
jgi:hypothetical protein